MLQGYLHVYILHILTKTLKSTFQNNFISKLQQMQEQCTIVEQCSPPLRCFCDPPVDQNKLKSSTVLEHCSMPKVQRSKRVIHPLIASCYASFLPLDSSVCFAGCSFLLFSGIKSAWMSNMAFRIFWPKRNESLGEEQGRENDQKYATELDSSYFIGFY